MNADERSASETQIASRIPPSAHVTIHAYDLLKNPYAHQGEVVQLNCSDLPLLIGENSIAVFRNIPRGLTSSASRGWAWVQFDRIKAKGEAIGNILGRDFGAHGLV